MLAVSLFTCTLSEKKWILYIINVVNISANLYQSAQVEKKRFLVR